jgi:Ca2+-dependent lipid-binding protein
MFVSLSLSLFISFVIFEWNEVVEAKELFEKKKTGNVFCKCIYAKEEYITQTIRETSTPNWNETVTLYVTHTICYFIELFV